MDTIFADIPGVVYVQDDIASSGTNRTDSFSSATLITTDLTVQPEKFTLLKKKENRLFDAY